MIAICVGHSRAGDDGAVSVGGVSEHRYNTELARLISEELERRGVPHKVISEYKGNGYGQAIGWVANHLKQIGAIVAIELHFNSADSPEAGGHEWLFWEKSNNARLLAANLSGIVTLAFGNKGLRRRGIKSRCASDRGAEFLRRTPCPAVICEPFFGSNQEDWDLMSQEKNQVSLAYLIAGELVDFVKGALA